MSEDSDRAAWLLQVRSYLRNADPVLARLIDDRPDFDPQAWRAQLPPMDLYGALLFQVTGQQLSVASTRRILGRIQALFGGRLPAPAELLALDPARLREAGLSWRKIGNASRPSRANDGRTAGPGRADHPARRRAHGRAHRHPRDRPLDRPGRPARRAGARGRRAAGRPGAAQGHQAAYRLDHLPSQQEVLAIAEKWRPYRSLATSYLFSAVFQPAERAEPSPAKAPAAARPRTPAAKTPVAGRSRAPRKAR